MDIIQKKYIVAEQCLRDIERGDHHSLRELATISRLSRPTVTKIFQNVMECPEKFQGIDDMSKTQLKELFASHASNIEIVEPVDAKHWLTLEKMFGVKRNKAFELYCQSATDKPCCRSKFYDIVGAEEKKLPATMLLKHSPEEAQVDFAGKRPWLVNPETGNRYQVELFIATMAHGDYTFVRSCYTQSLEDWIAMHQAWFTFLGGVPRLVICDNLKAAVRTGGKDFTLTRSYKDFARHCGFNVIPARAYHPQDKADVEGEVHRGAYSIMSELAGKEFFSVEELNAAIEPLNYEYNKKPFVELEGSRESCFLAAGVKYLGALPVVEYDPPIDRRSQTVKSHYHVRFNKHKYSVPWTLIGEKVDIIITATRLRCYFDGAKVADHALSNDIGGKTTETEHMKPEHAYYKGLGEEEMIQWAAEIGPYSKALIEAQFSIRSNQFRNVKNDCGEFRKIANKVGTKQFEEMAALAAGRSCFSLDVFNALIQYGGQAS